MGMVHGHDIGDEIDIADKAGEIGDRRQPVIGLDQKGGMGDVAQAHRMGGQGIAKTGLVEIGKARRGLRDGDAMAGAAVLLGKDWRAEADLREDKSSDETDHESNLPLTLGKDSTNCRRVSLLRCARAGRA